MAILSPGTLYPTLHSLEEQNAIRRNSIRRTARQSA
jgi:DNA-binding PadR family transcriptional regulator